jgi:pimeloyl-ACP methyl ester carboxylesterase
VRKARKPVKRPAKQPVKRTAKKALIAIRDQDIMVPTENSIDMARRIPSAQLVIYEDAGHGGIFQNHADFVPKALSFLDA